MLKHKILSIIIAIFGLTLSAGAAQRMTLATKAQPKLLPGVPVMENPIYNPEGSDEAYIMNVTENTFWGDEDVDGYKMTIRRSADGKKIYFQDLTPGFNGDANTEGYSWVAGDINGTDITIPAGQVLYKSPDQVLYLEIVTVDDYGQVEEFKDDIHFTIDGETIRQADNSLRVSVFKNGDTMDEAGFFIFMNNFEILPMGDVTTFTPPADAEVEQWMMTCDTGSRFMKVARSGNDVYVAGFSSMSPDDYVVGTIQNGKLSFRSGYILTNADTRYIRLIGASEGEPDEWGYPTLTMSSEYTFDVNEAEDHFTLNPSSDYIVEASYFNFTMLNGITNVELFRYAGDKPATPATPEIVSWSDEDQLIRINVPCTDEDGNFINPEHLAYRIYLDGALYEFTPDDYYYLPESMTDLPYSFTDQYDIYSNGDIKTIFFHGPAFNTLEVESIYTVDNDARVSQRAVYAGIGSIDADHGTAVDTEYTDVLGRKVANPQPGMFVIKTTKYADGTRNVSKIVVR